MPSVQPVPDPPVERRRYYLDHASTSFPKPEEVWDCFQHHARSIGAPAGRSAYGDAIEMDRQIEEARRTLARFFGARPERVAFTLNATDALNTALKGYLRRGDHVVTTQMEHNSVQRPLSALERERGITVTRVAPGEDGFVDAAEFERALRPDTRLVAMVHASNVTGTILPLEEVSRLARERGIAFLLDAAQTAGTLPVSLERDPIDFLAVPGHKGLLGPAGTGALILSERVDCRPLREGGTGSRSEEIVQPPEYPQRLEAGSPNGPGIVALGAAVRYLERHGPETVRRHLEELMGIFQEGLDGVPGLTWYGPREIARREPVYAVHLAGYRCDELAGLLDATFGVQVRAGLHCAPGAHRAIGTFPEGACRFSLGATSSREDVEAALEALAEIARK